MYVLYAEYSVINSVTQGEIKPRRQFTSSEVSHVTPGTHFVYMAMNQRKQAEESMIDR